MKKSVPKASRMLRNARLKKRWTLRQLGKMLGYGYGNFVGMMESGQSQIPIELVPLLCDLLDMDTKKFLKEVMVCRYPGAARFL